MSENRRPVRPNFAEDVYGSPSQDSNSTEMSESSLAQRRSAVLPKLKDFRGSETPSRADDKEAAGDGESIDFSYNDADEYSAELAELYSYSEIDEFGLNAQAYRSFMESAEGLFENVGTFADCGRRVQQDIVRAMCERFEAIQPERRLCAARALLYVLQGAYMDFDDDDDEQMKGEHSSIERGTGGYEKECLLRAAKYAYLVAEAGCFDSIAMYMLYEINQPYDLPSDGRESKASSTHGINLRYSSSCDLADGNSRRLKLTATMADNVALRVSMAVMYHLVETIRRESLINDLADTPEAREHLKVVRQSFIEELESPFTTSTKPLVIILSEMLEPFYRAIAPQYPIKKILLLLWKILLATHGGWDELRHMKESKREAAALPIMEDSLTVAKNLKAVSISDGDMPMGGRLSATSAQRRFVTARTLGRQMATTENEDVIEPDEAGSATPMDTSSDQVTDMADDTVLMATSQSSNSSTNSNSSEDGGERTPRATSPSNVPRNKFLWKPKVRQEDIEAVLQNSRNKFFKYGLPGDTQTLFGLPEPVSRSLSALRQHLYISLAEMQIQKEDDYNRYAFSVKEEVETSKTEVLYRYLLPSISMYVVALLKILLSAAPSTKAKNESVNVLSDLLTPETENAETLSLSVSIDRSSGPLEDSMRLTLDIYRHKEIIVKAASAITLLLLKHFKLNHVYQFEAFAQQLVYGNGIPLMLKFLDHNMVRYVKTRHELHAYNYPQCALYWARNRECFPVLNEDNVEEKKEGEEHRYTWRNIFSAINMVRILNKLTKWKHARMMMLVVFKSAPILKRCLKLKLGLFQLYVLKLLKMQARCLGRQWRRTNMDIISAIYCSVRHRLTDDWAFGNDQRSKSWDFQADELALKILVDRFNSRRYGKLHPSFMLEVNETTLPGDNYLNNLDPREFEPLDNCAMSVLGEHVELSDGFKRNYEKWLRREVLNHSTDWDKLLKDSRGIAPHKSVKPTPA